MRETLGCHRPDVQNGFRAPHMGWQGSLLPKWAPATVWAAYLSMNFPIYQYMNSRGVGPLSILLLALHHLCAAVGGALAALDVFAERYLR